MAGAGLGVLAVAFGLALVCVGLSAGLAKSTMIWMTRPAR